MAFQSRERLKSQGYYLHGCPCGNYLGDGERECTCTPYQIQRYRHRLSGPLLDRIDLQIEVPALKYADLQESKGTETSAVVRTRVEEARWRQLARLKDRGFYYNAQIPGHLLPTFSKMSRSARILLKKAFTQLGLSMRAHDRVLRMALTIADLAGKDRVEEEHLAESLQYRLWDREQV
ncbi:MAG TPA: ATP-binding protein [Clostridia bacterium]|nr:ATP-binding protein [Clostridia bacterium]